MTLNKNVSKPLIKSTFFSHLLCRFIQIKKCLDKKSVKIILICVENKQYVQVMRHFNYIHKKTERNQKNFV